MVNLLIRKYEKCVNDGRIDKKFSGGLSSFMHHDYMNQKDFIMNRLYHRTSVRRFFAGKGRPTVKAGDGVTGRCPVKKHFWNDNQSTRRRTKH